MNSSCIFYRQQFCRKHKAIERYWYDEKGLHIDLVPR